MAADYPQRERKSWPQRKALRNQTYRRQVQRSIARSLAPAEELGDVAAASPRRRLSVRRHAAVRLGTWVRWGLATRVHRTGWNFFKERYDAARHREAFVGFLRAVTQGRPARQPLLVELFTGLLDGRAPMDLPGEFRRYHRTGTDAVAGVREFFRDEPEWEGRVRRWVKSGELT